MSNATITSCPRCRVGQWIRNYGEAFCLQCGYHEGDALDVAVGSQQPERGPRHNPAQTQRSEILRVLRGGMMTEEELARRTGLEASVVTEQLSALAAARQVRRWRRGIGGVLVLWELVEGAP